MMNLSLRSGGFATSACLKQQWLASMTGCPRLLLSDSRRLYGSQHPESALHEKRPGSRRPAVPSRLVVAMSLRAPATPRLRLLAKRMMRAEIGGRGSAFSASRSVQRRLQPCLTHTVHYAGGLVQTGYARRSRAGSREGLGPVLLGWHLTADRTRHRLRCVNRTRSLGCGERTYR
jgi:hypothetical protein